MPLNGIPSGDFVNREADIDYLKHFALSRETVLSGNVLLEAARGMGKTELLKQIHRLFFREDGNVVPFYYSFRRAALKTTFFARDYFSRFIRQFLAQVKQDPLLAENMSLPLASLVPIMHELKLTWMIELVDNFLEHMQNSDHQAQFLAAISAPLTAARSGKTVLVMLDDFHMAQHIFETSPGDLYGAISLFEDSINSSFCPHILTGSPEGTLESLFTDSSLRGKAERIFIGPLPEDAARFLFGSLCDRAGIGNNPDVSFRFMGLLGGNPLYIRNMVKSLRNMQKKEISERDLWECYSYEVSQGETFFYWSSVLGEFLGNSGDRRMAARILKESTMSDADPSDSVMFSRILGVPESSLVPVLKAVTLAGMLRPQSGGPKDHVLQDFISSLHMREIGRLSEERVRGVIESKYFPAESEASSFEITIPMAPDAELVAAKAVEQIGRNAGLASDVTDQIQLALIESCINAMEHSGSYDKKVFLRVFMREDQMEIIIESPGKFFRTDMEDHPGVEQSLSSGRKRGWGLKLMRRIMDDVRIERLADRTRVILIKNIKPEEVLHESSEF